jgi:hypothetical protein
VKVNSHPTWGVGSQMDYQVFGLFGYRIKPAMALQAGYRYFYFDYQARFRRLPGPRLGVIIFGVSITLK